MRSIVALVVDAVLGRLEVGELADVGARHERLAARAAQHQHAARRRRRRPPRSARTAPRTSPTSSRCAPRGGRTSATRPAPRRSCRTLTRAPRSRRRRSRPRAAPRRCAGRAAAPRGGPSRGVSESFTGIPSAAHRALLGVLHLDLHLARLRVRVGEHLGVVVDRPGGHAGLLERRRPTRPSPRAASVSSSSACSSARFAIRSALTAKRVVGEQSSRPIAAHSRSHSRCVFAPTVRWPSRRAQRLVGRASAGARSRASAARSRSPTAPPSPTRRTPARPRTARCRSAGRGRSARAPRARTGCRRRRTGRPRGRRPGRRTSPGRRPARR